MKHRMFFLGIACIAALAFSGCAQKEQTQNPAENAPLAAQTAKPASDFTTKLTQGGKGVVITGYTGTAAAVVIPAAIEGIPVLEICGQIIDEIKYHSTFGDKIISVTIPNSVTKIGHFAFLDFRSLASITIPNSVTEIGWRAFFGCTNLVRVTIPDSVTAIGDMAFSGCTSLASVIIPSSVTEIGVGAFSGCTSLASVTIPNSVMEIGDWAFEGCTNLASVTLAAGATIEFGEDVFKGCENLSQQVKDTLRKAGYEGEF